MDVGSVGMLAHKSQVMDESSDYWQLPDPRVLQASPLWSNARVPAPGEPEGGGELGTRPLRAGRKPVRPPPHPLTPGL